MPELPLAFVHPDILALLKPLGVAGLGFAALGYVVKILWTDNQSLRHFYEGDPKDPEGKPGRIEEIRRETKAEREAMQTKFDAKIDTLHEEQKAMLKDLNDTLKELLGQADKDKSE